MDYRRRIARLREELAARELDGLLVTSLTNVRYLSGFTGSAGELLVTADQCQLATDGRYADRAASEMDACGSGVDLVDDPARAAHAFVTASLGSTGKLGLEASHVTMEAHAHLAEELPNLRLVPTTRVVEDVRLTKDRGERARMEAAAAIVDQAFPSSVALLTRGVTERELARSLDRAIVDLGADGPAFPTIVASGVNSSMPHATPGDKVIGRGELTVVDVGASVDGYRSDMTRTIWFGSLDPEDARIYEATLASNAAGIASLAPGVTHAEVDARCRAVYADYGYLDAVMHPSGHNVGLSIHELPYLRPGADQPMGNGYVVTVEPGIYFRGRAGCRVEDMLAVEDGGSRRLTRTPKPGSSEGWV